MYDAQADTINVDDIATNSNNRIVLRRIKRNNEDDTNELWIQNEHDKDGEDCVDYVPEGADDMGWLGYFVGKNQHLEDLMIETFIPTSEANYRLVMEPFLRGISRNKSIREISFSGVDLLGGEMFTMLGSFFRDNYNLTNINIKECNLGDEGCRLFALALGNCTNKSLQKLKLEDADISDEGIVDIITSLSMFPHLEYLDLEGNHLHKNGCVALATLLRCSATELKHLFISRNDIGDEGIEVLVPALTTCYHLRRLHISDNPSITTRGWQRLATILQSPNSDLREFYIPNNNTDDDDTLAAFTSALLNNHKLEELLLSENSLILQSFPKVLCDTSSVNATFLSNHTLHDLGGEVNENEIIGPLLRLNRRNDKKDVATVKILQHHRDFDMLPFFEWEFKVLPMVLDWLERAYEYEMPEDFEPNIGRRKLSTIYQFVRGMPVLYVETRLRKELEDIKVAESQLEEEGLQGEFTQLKQLLQERKKSIIRKLGGKSLQKR